MYLPPMTEVDRSFLEGPGLRLPSLLPGTGSKKLPSQLVAPTELVDTKDMVLPVMVPTKLLRLFFLL
jgi:hypothetical protein